MDALPDKPEIALDSGRRPYMSSSILLESWPRYLVLHWRRLKPMFLIPLSSVQVLLNLLS